MSLLLSLSTQPLERATFKEDHETIHAIVKRIKEKIPILLSSLETKKNLLKSLEQVQSLQGYEYVTLFESFDLEKENQQFQLVLLCINTKRRKHSSKSYIQYEIVPEYEFIGHIQLTKNYGDVHIRPETFQDKINEWFTPIEVDFKEDKEFSKKYYVLASDEQQLRQNITPLFLAAIKKYNDLEIEIHKNQLTVRLRKGIDPKASIQLVNFLHSICGKECI